MRLLKGRFIMKAETNRSAERGHSAQAPSEECFQTEELSLQGLQFDSCVQDAYELLKSIDGINEVIVDKDKQMARIKYDVRLTSMPIIRDLLLRSGYKFD
jgi:hypothetical protein